MIPKLIVLVLLVGMTTALFSLGYAMKKDSDRLEDYLCSTGRHPDRCGVHGWIF